MELTIILVNWNGGELLLRCLQTIKASRTSFEVQVMVVDNDSRDGSREAAREAFPEFHIFNSGANLGFGRANNLARTMVRTPLILFLNPDTELKPDTLERAVKCLMARPEVGALGCKMRYPDGQIQEQGWQWFPSPLTIFAELMLSSRRSKRLFRRWLPAIDPNQSGYIRKLYGGFVLARKEVLDRAGWFDDRYFMYAEDVDLSRTICDLGWKLYYTSEAEIIHVSGGTSAKAPSGFSVLMKQESINKLMRKYQGRTGAALHRLAIGAGAGFRWLALAGGRLFAGRSGSERFQQWKNSMFKQQLLILWAIGVRKPVIATSRTPSPAPALAGTGSRSTHV